MLLKLYGLGKLFCLSTWQVKKAMEVTHRLGGVNYVFWGGRFVSHLIFDCALSSIGSIFERSAELSLTISLQDDHLLEKIFLYFFSYDYYSCDYNYY